MSMNTIDHLLVKATNPPMPLWPNYQESRVSRGQRCTLRLRLGDEEHGLNEVVTLEH